MPIFPKLWTGRNESAGTEVYLCAGQSNWVGWSDQAVAVIPSAYYQREIIAVAPPPLEFKYIFTFPHSASSAVPAFAAARWALGRRTIILACADGGTRLALDPEADVILGTTARWDPTAGRLLAPGTGRTEVAGDMYRNMLDTVAMFGDRPRALLWLQGEQEALVANTLQRDEYQPNFDRYYAALYAFVTAVWQDLHIPTVVAPVSKLDLFTGGPPPEYAPVHDAALAVIAAHPYAFAGPLHDDLSLMDAVDPGNRHIRDVNELGARWSTAVSAALD